MFKNYTICEQKIHIEAPDFPGDCSDWRLFETSFEEADVSVNCHVAEGLPMLMAVLLRIQENFLFIAKRI